MPDHSPTPSRRPRPRGGWKATLKRRLVRHPRIFHAAQRLYRRLRRIVGALRRRAPGEHWDALVGDVESGAHKGWLDWQWVEREHVRPQVSGDRDVYYLEHFRRRHLHHAPVGRLLSLGCGGGNLERALFAMGFAEHIDAYDASHESIRLARELAAEEGLDEVLHYEVADIDALELPADAYDVVICKMSLHHFAALEHVYAQIRRALRRDGLFVFNEFVGPTRFQWTDEQLELINRIFDCLPPSIRDEVLIPGFVRPTVEYMIESDPTESVRSGEIMQLLEQDFEIVEHKPYGGTLLNLLLSESMHLFDQQNPEHVSILRLLSLFERTLIDKGVLASDFVYVVARPR